MAQNPHHRRYRAHRRDWRSSERVEGPGGGAGSRWWGRGRVGPGTVPGTVAVRQARQNSPSTPSPPLNPRQNSPSATAPSVFSRQNSPSNLKNVKFGVFRARRANFFTRQTRRRGDFETIDASATADAGQYETAVTTARP